MITVSDKKIAMVREKVGMGVMECKQMLKITDGNVQDAIDMLLKYSDKLMGFHDPPFDFNKAYENMKAEQNQTPQP